MGQSERKVVPVLLSGGAGTRLWPLSRQSYPKQFLPLLEQRTLLQKTALRVSDVAGLREPIVVAGQDHRFLIAEQLRACGVVARIVLEPLGRNTAPAAAVAALLAIQQDPGALLLLLPSDHAIADEAAFRDSVVQAQEAAESGAFVLFGCRPTEPATGYGYIEVGPPSAKAGARAVLSFHEKPDSETAGRYVAEGRFLWNSGLFLFPAQLLLEELELRAPALLAACRAALEGARHDLDFLHLDREAFAQAPAISIDHAVMEKTQRAVVLPLEAGWSDVGSWQSLWQLETKDGQGTVLKGEAFSEGARGCYLRGEGVVVAAAHVENLVVVATPDAVYVGPRERDQNVRDLVERLRARGKAAATESPSVFRPWGFYQSLQAGERYQVKRITVYPGGRLSLQRHHHRAEHWVVVHGTALVTRDEERFHVHENQSVFIPQGAAHRLENPGKVPLNLIEVQTGGYLGEDDIVRLDDVYGRGPEGLC